MGPSVLLGEALQEAGCGDAATWRAADVGHVGEVGLELLLVGVLDRHAPCGIANGLARCQQFVGQRVVGIVMAGEQAGVVMAERGYAGAGQGGDVDHDGRLEAFSICQRVA